MRYIGRAADGTLLPYKEWVVPKDDLPDPRALMAIGAGGVMYPPGALDSQVQDVRLFLEICPKSDDLWFKAMGLLAGTCV